jgi:hypothetical protein
MEFDIVGFVKEYVLVQWQFAVASLVIGILGQFFKTRIWTKERALVGTPHWLWWWGRATIPLHAPVVGFWFGIALCWTYGENPPAGPGVNGPVQVVMYYVAAGSLSSLTYDLIKKFAKEKLAVQRDA